MIGRKPISEPPRGWPGVALWLSPSVVFLVILLAESMIPALRKPIEPLLCEREIVFVSYRRGVGRVVCPAEGSGMVYGVFRGERRDVTLLYYALLALLYGATSFAVLSAWHFAFSRRGGG
jgi:hypothetical protein